MTLLTWGTRCVPFLLTSCVFVVILLALAVNPYGRADVPLLDHPGARGATIAQAMLSVYMVALHVLALLFPLRLCRAISDLLVHLEREPLMHDDIKRDDLEEKKTSETSELIFAILLPSYKEDMGTLTDTLRVLAAHPESCKTYDIYLAMEEKEIGSSTKAAELMEKFRKSFRKVRYTQHPAGLPGEAQGKSSNISWAAKEAGRHYKASESKPTVILTVMDADTHLMPSYFQLVRQMHLAHPSTSRTTLYVPPIIFDRNMHRVPLGVRLADMLWCGAGLSGLRCTSTTAIPTSVYSLPLELAERVGGWDVGPVSIGEDLHMWLKCSVALSANLTTRVVYSPASQCNVDTDLKGARGYLSGLNARYVQALRHTWGALDVGYVVSEVCDSIIQSLQRERAIQESRAVQLRAENANWTAFYTTYNLTSLGRKGEQELPRQPLHLRNSVTITHRMFEAHFLPLHLTLTLVTTSIYCLVYPPALMPGLLYGAFVISGWLRVFGYIAMLCFFALYQRYHRLGVGRRENCMRAAGLYEDFKEKDYFSESCFPVAGFIEVVVFPISGFIFGSLPAAVAITCHLWTDSLVYVVSIKPQSAVDFLVSKV